MSMLGFPIGWYTGLSHVGRLPQIADDGMSAVIPYHTTDADVRPYLDAAQGHGIGVWLEIPRLLVKAVDTTGVEAFVNAYSAHPAIQGWYLADEPSTNTTLGPLSASNAVLLYETVKATDPSRPVAVCFWNDEPAASYSPAMDVMAWNYYPFDTLDLEFQGLANWTTKLRERAAVARGESGFFPVLQAYGELLTGKRLPTFAELRYMTHAPLKEGATGVFYWVQYKSDPSWVASVLGPIVADLNVMRPALARGEVPATVTSSHSDVSAVAFWDDPSTFFIVAVHHGAGTVDAPLTLSPSITAKSAYRMGPDPKTVRIRNGKLPQQMGPWQVHVYRVA